MGIMTNFRVQDMPNQEPAEAAPIVAEAPKSKKAAKPAPAPEPVAVVEPEPEPITDVEPEVDEIVDIDIDEPVADEPTE